jgi:phosphonate transport system permease protein
MTIIHLAQKRHIMTHTVSGSWQRVPDPPRLPRKSLISRSGLATLAVLIIFWSYQGAEIAPLQLTKHAENMWEFAQGFANPDFTYWKEIARQMIITIQIAIWGSLLAVILAVPFGLLSASNITPLWIHQPARRLMDAARAINEMIFAMFFIAAVGLGPFAGVLALFVHTLGILAKLFSEAVEAIEPGPVEGIKVTGANWLEEVIFGIIPQVLPLWISYSLYRFESNVRSAAVVGMVGAGGIGFMIWDAIRSFDYGQTAAIILVILVSVSLLDLVSAQIRKQFI